jgi:hypothetical protein
LGKTAGFDPANPKPALEGQDTQPLWNKIQSLSGAQARKLGLNKSMLHYLRKRAKDQKPFSIYEPVLVRLNDS